MEYNSIRHKLNKYQNKLTLESNQYKKALYAEKVGHYRQLLQSGGDLATIISEGTIAVNNDLTKILEAITNKKGATIPGNLLKEFGTNLNDLQTHIGKYQDQTMDATINFANYNIQVRNNFRTALEEVNNLNPLTQTEINELDRINTEIKKLKLDEISQNQNLVGLIGILGGDTLYANMKTDLTNLTKEATKMPVIYQKTKDFAKTILDIVDKKVKDTANILKKQVPDPQDPKKMIKQDTDQGERDQLEIEIQSVLQLINQKPVSI
jgi:hypothetical protein